METEKHGGLPQHRCRIYICGIRVDCQVREFVWPVEFPETLTLTQVLGPECCSLSEQLAALRNCDNLPQTAMKNFHAFAEVLQRTPGDYILDAGGPSRISCLAARHVSWLHGVKGNLVTGQMPEGGGWCQMTSSSCMACLHMLALDGPLSFRRRSWGTCAETPCRWEL